ncbi:MAG: FAD-binding protein [Gammaproteobacteria bacterium]|nr:FAD-binding protein [Gammaproteobacteria bacterium]
MNYRSSDRLSRRAFLASSLRAALFGAYALNSVAYAQQTPWRNWSGGLSCQPKGRYDIATEDQLAELLKSTAGAVRPVGSGHSFSPLVPTDGHLVVIDQLNGILDYDSDTMEATLGAGSRLGDLGAPLAAIGQGMMNLPDIDRQTLAGATATGTHGTGIRFKSLSGYITGLRLVTPAGDIMDIDAGDGDLFDAARVNVGALGVVTRIRMQNRSAYKLKKREWTAPTEELLAEFDERAASHRHFEIFPLVYSDYSLALQIDESDEPIGQTVIPGEETTLADLRPLGVDATPAEKLAMNNGLAMNAEVSEAVDLSYKLLSNVRSNPFNEMEYSVPAEVGADCVREILRTIYDQAIDVAFPLEFRYVSPEDPWLSMAYGDEPHATISIHRTARADYKPYFDIIEPIFWKYGGRPHWGKIHSLSHRELSALYPRFRDFMEIRQSLDPQGRMLNEHLRNLFDA